MSKVDCYDKKGIKHAKEPVDARECVAVLGWALTQPEVKVKKETAAEKKIRVAAEKEAVKNEQDTALSVDE